MVDYFAPAQRYAQQPVFQPPEPEMTPEERQSILGRMYESSLGGLGYIGKLLDKTFGGRAVRGLLGGRPEELLSIIPGSDTLGITNDANTVQGTDLLADAGLVTRGDNGFLNTVAGLGVEMALDPSTYLAIGPLTKTGQAAVKAGTATKGLAAGIRAGERGLVGFGLPFQRPVDDVIFGAGRPAAPAKYGDAAIGAAGSAVLDDPNMLYRSFEYPEEAIGGSRHFLKGTSTGYGGAYTMEMPNRSAFEVGTNQSLKSKVSADDVSRVFYNTDYFPGGIDPDGLRQVRDLFPNATLQPTLLNDAETGLVSQAVPELAAGIPHGPMLSRPVSGYEGAAPFVDAVSRYAGQVVSKPLDVAEWAARPLESLFGANPVRKARDIGAATGRAVGALFAPSKEQAFTSVGQDLAGVYGDTRKAYAKPGRELYGDLSEEIDSLGKKYGPEAQAEIRRAANVALEVPSDIEPFVARATRQFEFDVADALSKGEVIPADVAAMRKAKFERDAKFVADPAKAPKPERYSKLVADLKNTETADAAILRLNQKLPGSVDATQLAEAQRRQALRDKPGHIAKLEAEAKAKYDAAVASRAEKASRLGEQSSLYDELAQLGVEDPFRLSKSAIEKVVEAKAVRDQKLNALQLGQAYRAANDPIATLSKYLSPEEVARMESKFGDVRDFVDVAKDERIKRGIKSAELDDNLLYMFRQKNKLPPTPGVGMAEAARQAAREGNAAADPTQIRRLDALRGIPGGTQQWEDIVADASLKDMPDDQLEGAFRKILSGSEQPAKSSPVWKQAKDMLGLYRSLDPRIGKDGVTFFNPDTAAAIKQYGENYSRKMATTEVIYEGVSRVSQTAEEMAKSGKNGVKVQDLLDRIGAESPDKAKQVWQPIADKLGVPIKDVADRFVPADVAADMLRMGTAWKTPESMAPVIEGYGKMLDWFKTGVTAPFPSFYVRNFLGGLFNSWRGEALNLKTMDDTQTILRGGLMSSQTTADLAKSLPQYFGGKTPEEATAQFKKLALAYDVAFGRQGQQSGDMLGQAGTLLPSQLPDNTKGVAKPVKSVVTDTLKMLGPDAELKAKGYGTARQYLDPTAVEGVSTPENVNRLVATGRAIGKQSEDFLRGNHFLEKMRQGFIPEVAAEEVSKYHIDYSRATQFEKNVMKKIMPWYSFTRGNLPPILEDLASQPAKIAQTTRAITGARDRDQFTPQYIAEGASFPLGESAPGTNRYISSFGLPVEDEAIKTLGSALSGDYRRVLQQMGGMGLPYIKAPAEIAFDTQLYSGRRLSDLEPSKIASLGGVLPDQAAQLATQFVANTPLARVVSTGDRFLDSRKGLGATALNTLTGLRLSDVDVERARLAAERQMLQDLLRPSNRTRVQERVYVPKDQMDKLTPDEKFIYDLMQGVQRDAMALTKRPRE